MSSRKYYCIRVGDQYVSGACTPGGCVPKLVANPNFAYVYDSREEAEAAMRYVRLSQVTWDPKIGTL